MIRSTEQTLYRLDNLNKEQQRISYQMSTGKKLQYGSDDSNTYSREVFINDKIKMYEGIKLQIEKTNSQNNSSDATLADAKDLVSYVKTEVMKALSATTEDTGKISIATNLKGVKENLYMLANEQVEGEYLFSGSDSSVRPFDMDETTGKVSYLGDANLRKVVVEDGSYRDRGVNGLESFYFTSSTAEQGETLTFHEGDKIFDQDGNEWVLDGSKTNIVKLDNSGNATSDTISLTNDGAIPPLYSASITNSGDDFEAKTSVFDILDNIINSLEKVDSAGNTISDTEVHAALKDGLDDISSAYDAMNVGHAKLGARNKVFEISYERVSSKVTQYNVLSTEVGAADISKVAVEAKALELTFTALYSTINRMNELSLTNFLR